MWPFQENRQEDKQVVSFCLESRFYTHEMQSIYFTCPVHTISTHIFNLFEYCSIVDTEIIRNKMIQLYFTESLIAFISSPPPQVTRLNN